MMEGKRNCESKSLSAMLKNNKNEEVNSFLCIKARRAKQSVKVDFATEISILQHVMVLS